jgi:probable rRNA maturation factor
MIDIEIEDEAWATALPDVEKIALDAARAALLGPPPLGKDQTIVVLLTDDETVRDLNARFRGKDASTNVLSFPAHDSAHGHLGDIALAYGVCVREAVEQGKPLAAHLQHLVAHGVLHLVGYDHEDDAEAEVMEDLERRILATLGLPDPYQDRQGS